MNPEKYSETKRERPMSLTDEVHHKLNALGGGADTPLKIRLHEIRKRLGWWDCGADGRIKRLIYGEQKAHEFIDEIRRAYARHCVNQVESNREATRKLAEQFSRAIAHFEATDPDFYRDQIEAMVGALGRMEHRPVGTGSPD